MLAYFNKKGLLLQEFMGFQFHIRVDKRIKVSSFRCNAEGILTFCFPLYTKNTLHHAKQYIHNNHALIEKIRTKQQQKYADKQHHAMQYIKQYPSMLLLFGVCISVADASIESLSKQLFIKAKALLDEYANAMKLVYTDLKISYAKSYLGQCDSKARIKIDYRNVLSDEVLLRYLIVHELAHIRYPNHSQSFWQEVARYYPDYKNARHELKKMADRNAFILHYYHLLPQSLCKI